MRLRISTAIMAILVDKNSKVLVQGITGREGEFHTRQMLEYGTKIVAGTTPGKEGETLSGVPVFNKVKTAVNKTGANASVIFVPAPFAPDAIYEALDAGIKVIVCITEGVPIQDMVKVVRFVREEGAHLIGPNCPGITTPGVAKLGIMPGKIFMRGNIGVVSRSGTLTYEMVNLLTKSGLGQSTCIGIGGDPIIGTRFKDVIRLFAKDPDTKGIVLVGEIGGTDEEEAAEEIAARTLKIPVVSFIAGRTAPPGKRMGHAGAIVSGTSGTAEAKIKALSRAGVPVADTVPQVVDLLRHALEKEKATVKTKSS